MSSRQKSYKHDNSKRERSYMDQSSMQRSKVQNTFNDQSSMFRSKGHHMYDMSTSQGDSVFTPSVKHRQQTGMLSYIERPNRTGFDSLDNLDVSPSHFTLPSFANSREYLDEEEDMDNLVNRVEQIFPSNLSYSGKLVITRNARSHC